MLRINDYGDVNEVREIYDKIIERIMEFYPDFYENLEFVHDFQESLEAHIDHDIEYIFESQYDGTPVEFYGIQYSDDPYPRYEVNYMIGTNTTGWFFYKL